MNTTGTKRRRSPYWATCVMAAGVLTATAATAAAPAAPAERSLEGRHRIELRMGYWEPGHQEIEPMPLDFTGEMTRVENLLGSLSYAYWTHDQLATDITVSGLLVEATSIDGVWGGSESAVVLSTVTFGLRLYPISSAHTPVRPYLSGGIGPYIGTQSRREVNGRMVESVRTLGSIGGYLGGGIDVQMGRHMMAGVSVGYHMMNEFSEPIGGEREYNGYQLSAGLSVLLGSGSQR